MKRWEYLVASLIVCIMLGSAEAGSLQSPFSSVQFQKVEPSQELPTEAPIYIFRHSDSSQWFFYADKVVRRLGTRLIQKRYPSFALSQFNQSPRIEVRQINEDILFSLGSFLMRLNKHSLEFDLLEDFSAEREKITGFEGLSSGAVFVATHRNIYLKNGVDTKAIKQVLDEDMFPTKYKSIAAFKTINSGRLTDEIWVGSFFGSIYRVSSINNKLQFERFDLPFDGRHVIYSLAKYGNNKIFIGASSGLYQLDLESNIFHKIENQIKLKEVAELKVSSNQIWLIANQKVYAYEPAVSELTEFNSQDSFDSDSYQIIHLSVDQENLVWLSMKGKGIFYYSKQRNRVQPIRSSIIHNTSGSFNLVKSLNDSLVISKGDTTEIIQKDEKLNLQMISTSAVKIRNGKYVLGGIGKIHFISEGKMELELKIPAVASAVTNITEDNEGNLWVLTQETGAFIYSSEKRELSNIRGHLNTTTIPRDIVVDDVGRIHFLTESKVYIVSYNNGELEVESSKNFPARVLTTQQLNGKIIAWAEDNSVYAYDSSSLAIKKSFLSDIPELSCIVSFQRSSGDILVAIKNSGLRHYTKDGVLIRTLGPADGVPNKGLDANWCLAYKEQLLFTSYGQIFSTDASRASVTKIKHDAPIIIDSVDLNGLSEITPVKFNNIIEQSNFPVKIKFYSANLSQLSNLKYAYKIDGLQDSWNSLEQQVINFDSLPAGNYILKIRARVGSNSWSEHSELAMTVKPPIWLSYWAMSLYAFLLVVLGFIFYTLKTRVLRKRAQHLEAVVAQRTLELEQVLDQKNEEFANVSHEFRTPLTLILGPINKLLNSKINDIEKKPLEVVKRNSYRLLRMVDQLLQLERFRVNQIITKRPIAIKNSAQLIAESFIDLANEKNVELEIEGVSDSWLMLTPDAFEKIILNLLSNAVKYTESGDSIKFSISSHSNKSLEIIVADTGIGIPTEKQSSIFKRFNRVLDSRSESVTGAGIGLALVKELVDKHQGTISIKSEVNVGTTFHVTLPVYAPTEDEIKQYQKFSQINQEFVVQEIQSLAEQKSLHNEVENEQSIVNENKISVLVVEDNPDMRSYIKETLSPFYQIFTAANGKIGLGKAIEIVPDLIISDVMMPEMDGFQLCRALKEEIVTSHIPIILLTARTDRASKLTGWRNKADEYLTKPFDAEELVLRVNSLLSIRQLLRTRLLKQTTSLENDTSSDIQISTELSEDDQDEKAWEAHEKQFIEKLSTEIERNIDNTELKVEHLAKTLAVSERQLYRKLKGILNVTPADFLKTYRLEKAVVLIRTGEPISNIAYSVGFSSHSYFSRCFKAKFGCSPSDFLINN